MKEAESAEVDQHVKGIVDRLTREAASARSIADQEKRKRAESADEIRKLQNELLESKRASSEEVARLQDKIEKLANSQHETEELRKRLQGSQKQLSQALEALEKEKTETEKLTSEAKSSRQRELAATEKMQFLERASKDGDKMASHIGALLESVGEVQHFSARLIVPIFSGPSNSSSTSTFRALQTAHDSSQRTLN
mmetsp:Transcript_37310/g.148866  ORF Transcript_37310/g.148866 Transcript_37310/m.148866 type:complete len:196 (-) Transcript_37310:432-1019(-)